MNANQRAMPAGQPQELGELNGGVRVHGVEIPGDSWRPMAFKHPERSAFAGVPQSDFTVTFDRLPWWNPPHDGPPPIGQTIKLAELLPRQCLGLIHGASITMGSPGAVDPVPLCRPAGSSTARLGRRTDPRTAPPPQAWGTATPAPSLHGPACMPSHAPVWTLDTDLELTRALSRTNVLPRCQAWRAGSGAASPSRASHAVTVLIAPTVPTLRRPIGARLLRPWPIRVGE